MFCYTCNISKELQIYKVAVHSWQTADKAIKRLFIIMNLRSFRDLIGTPIINQSLVALQAALFDLNLVDSAIFG